MTMTMFIIVILVKTMIMAIDDVLLKSNYDNTEYDDGGIHMM